MASPQQEEFNRSQRRQQVADLYLQGRTQTSIAAQLNVAQSTISEDLQYLQQAWQESAVDKIDEIRVRELKKIDLIEREAWSAWERSQKPAQSAVVTGDGTGNQTRKAMKNQIGDPRFLDQINKCIAQRRALLGLDVVAAAPPSEGPFDGNVTLEVRRERVVALFAAISERQGTGDAGTGTHGGHAGDVCAGDERGTLDNGAPHLQRLNQAILDTLAGQDGVRRLIVTLPPRHGKSELCSKYLPAWYLGTHPEHRVILASYEAGFAADWGRKARNILEQFGRSIFNIQVAKSPSAADHWNIADHAGGMQTAGVGGPITGKGATLLLVDDECKNAEEANSETMRKKSWDWWKSTAYTRLEPNGVAIVIQTRWHQDDLAGKLLTDMTQGGERWRVLNMPAINDAGEALWPERFPLERLLEIKRTIGSYFWSALYQQRPTPPEGGKFKREWFPIVASLPDGTRQAVRYWDKASTEGGGDYSVGCLIAKVDGLFYVVDVARGQWSDLQRERMIQQCAERDRYRFGWIATWIEQEPGSGGKDSAAATIRRLAGHSIRADRVTGDKELRAGPFAAQCEAGNVRLVRGAWNETFVDELCSFPHGSFDDQVDASSGSFTKLTQQRKLIVA